MAGAFDSLGGHRTQYMQIYPMVMNAAAQWKKVQMSGQIDLFDPGPEAADPAENDVMRRDPLPDVAEWPKEILLANEKEVLGLYLSGHPLSQVENVWRRTITHTAADFALAEDAEVSAAEHPIADGMEAVIGGIITRRTIKTTKNNKLMAFLTLEDLYGSVEIVAFPNTYERFRDLMEEDSRVFISGRVSMQEDKDASLVASEIRPMKSAPQPAAKESPVWLRFVSGKEWNALKSDVIQALSAEPGERAVRIYLETEKEKLKAPGSLNVNGSEELRVRLSRLIGEKNVVM